MLLQKILCWHWDSNPQPFGSRVLAWALASLQGLACLWFPLLETCTLGDVAAINLLDDVDIFYTTSWSHGTQLLALAHTLTIFGFPSMRPIGHYFFFLNYVQCDINPTTKLGIPQFTVKRKCVLGKGLVGNGVEVPEIDWNTTCN